MSDMSQGPGWWQASDGKWYPPEQAPGGQPQAGGAPGYGAQTYGAPAAGAYGAGGQGQLAEWPQRVIGYLADILCLLPLIILAMILGAVSSVLGLLMNLVVLAGSFYFAYLNGSTGQSPGKRLTGLKVVNEKTGQVIGGGNGIIRNIAHVLDSLVCLIGWFLPLFDAKKQTIADKVVGTVVVTGAEKQPFGPELFK